MRTRSLAPGIAEHFMLPYNFKVWATPAELMNLVWVWSGSHIVGVGIDRSANSTKNWIYFPEPEVPFYRVTYLSNYSPYMTASPDQTLLLTETSRSGFKSEPASRIVDRVVDGLVAARLDPGDDRSGRRPGVPLSPGAEGGSVIGFIVFGLVVGVIARLLVPGRQHLGIGLTILLGVIGSVIGGVVANALGTGDVWELNFLGSVVAIAASVVLIVLGERVGLGRRRSGSRG